MEKVARICWNTEGWEKPSGIGGKSSSVSTYEKIYGFGHEEWLLEKKREIDGYHYGFLQGLNVASGKHDGQTYDIHLFAVDPDKHRAYIGCLRNAYVIDEEEQKKVFEYYERQGWLSEMKEQVKSVGGVVNSDSFSPRLMFNVKFKFSEAEICLPVRSFISSYLCTRYVLMNKPADFIKEEDDDVVVDEAKLVGARTFIRKIESSEKLIDPRHREMQIAIVKLLKDSYKFRLEVPLVFGLRVDIVGKCIKTREWHYFEVKTGSTARRSTARRSTARLCIREALGQILEYSFYSSPSLRPSKLFIIGPEQPDDDGIDIVYLNYLREQYNLPIWYRYITKDNKLSEPI